MSGDDKAFAIAATAFLLGLGGSLVVGWPAVVAAAISIWGIARAKEPPHA